MLVSAVIQLQLIFHWFLPSEEEPGVTEAGAITHLETVVKLNFRTPFYISAEQLQFLHSSVPSLRIWRRIKALRRQRHSRKLAVYHDHTVRCGVPSTAICTRQFQGLR